MLGHRIGLLQFRVLIVGLYSNEVVLIGGDTRGDLLVFIDVLIQPHLLDNSRDESVRILLVIDGKVPRKAQFASFFPKDTRKNRVEGTHPQVACFTGAYDTPDTLLHLPCGLVGKGQR